MLSFSNNNKPFNIFRIAGVLLMTFVLMCCLSCSSMVLDTQPFDVLETAHFTFFYRKDGKTAKDLKKIAKYCENGINWLSAYLGFKIELKPDIYLFDNASGIITGEELYATAPNATKMRGWIFSLHVGNFGGIVTRIMWLLASLLGATLPLTGYYLWIKRKFFKRSNSHCKGN
jgi:hypothetical protein